MWTSIASLRAWIRHKRQGKGKFFLSLWAKRSIFSCPGYCYFISLDNPDWYSTYPLPGTVVEDTVVNNKKTSSSWPNIPQGLAHRRCSRNMWQMDGYAFSTFLLCPHSWWSFGPYKIRTDLAKMPEGFENIFKELVLTVLQNIFIVLVVLPNHCIYSLKCTLLF